MLLFMLFLIIEREDTFYMEGKKSINNTNNLRKNNYNAIVNNRFIYSPNSLLKIKLFKSIKSIHRIGCGGMYLSSILTLRS